MAESTELMAIDNICNRVYVIRGQQVMLDCDLAEIYGYEVKRLNEQVKRNITRFPEDFMFQLTKDEIDFVKSQIATSRNRNMYAGQDGGRRKAPYAFTEQGIYMLATVLRLPSIKAKERLQNWMLLYQRLHPVFSCKSEFSVGKKQWKTSENPWIYCRWHGILTIVSVIFEIVTMKSLQNVLFIV